MQVLSFLGTFEDAAGHGSFTNRTNRGIATSDNIFSNANPHDVSASPVGSAPQTA